MVRFKFFIFIFLLVYFNSFSQTFPDKRVDSLLKAGINQIIDQSYNKADSTFGILEKENKKLPFGKIYLAAVKIARSYDIGTPFDSDSISILLEQAIEQSEELIDKNENNIWNHYYLAMAEGYSAYYEALNGDFLGAVSTGLNSIDEFEICLQIDSTFYESYIAIGSYKYWKSRKIEFLNWIPFIDDEKDYGIELLEKAVNKSSYNTYVAINSLLWIYIDQEEYQKAVNLADSILTIHPESRIFKWALARAYEDIDVKKSIKEYNEILKSYRKLSPNNHYNEIILMHIIAQQYVKLGEYKMALNFCNEILTINKLDEYVKEKLEDRLERVVDLKKELIMREKS